MMLTFLGDSSDNRKWINLNSPYTASSKRRTLIPKTDAIEAQHPAHGYTSIREKYDESQHTIFLHL